MTQGLLTRHAGRMRLHRVIAPALATATLWAGCSSDQPSSARSATTRTAEAGPTTSVTVGPSTTTTTVGVARATADIRLDRYAIEPLELSVAESTLTLIVTNVDRVPHDVVLLRTDRPIDGLPTVGIRVDEADPAIEVLARTPRIDAGQHGELTATLSAGEYILVCTVPHHYVREAMVAMLRVTPGVPSDPHAPPHA